jgi:phosphatidylinositol alpha-mannosyltransferase
MIEAFRLVKRQYDNCRLIVVGDGPLRHYYRSLVDKEIAGDIHFAGLINGARPSYYATADIYCTPCTKASFGVVLLEAMAAGTPIVASDINGYRLVMEDNEQGILVPENEAAGFAEALLRMLNDPELRQRMGQAGRRKAVDTFSWDLVASRVEQYYMELLGRKMVVFTDEPALEKIFALND